ncbi:MAG: hypothetical protein PHG96_09160 [Kiritimatiellae bacterium]|nr:hypothetical protein [Kiritimatiellia bacterium]MDD3545508.1 hypothetical protein [Kiritimatiellia bacterium]MDD4025064.1 hypothetical protein [Kiritimatiellia bacterium]
MSEGDLSGQSDREVLRRLSVLLAVFAAVCLMAGASRMAPADWQLRTFGDVLRVREVLSMFVFAPAIGVLFWLIARCVGKGHTPVTVQVLMVLAVYFVACGMGMHDPLNRMQTVYPQHTLPPAVWRSLVYFDDSLGHWVFFGGFVLGTWVVGIQQVLAPLERRMGWRWACGFVLICMALLWVMLTNLWDEYPKTLVDICVVALAALVPLSVHLAFRRRVGLLRLPLLLVIYPAYFGSIVGTLSRWLLQGKI